MQNDNKSNDLEFVPGEPSSPPDASDRLNVEAASGKDSDVVESPHSPQPEPDKDITGLPPEVIAAMPPELRKICRVSVMQSHTQSGLHPTLPPLSSGQLDTLMNQSFEMEKEEIRLKESGRWFHLFYCLLAVGAFLFLVVYLLSNNYKEVLLDLLKIFVGLIGGFGGGYAVKAYQDRE